MGELWTVDMINDKTGVTISIQDIDAAVSSQAALAATQMMACPSDWRVTGTDRS